MEDSNYSSSCTMPPIISAKQSPHHYAAGDGQAQSQCSSDRGLASGPTWVPMLEPAALNNNRWLVAHGMPSQPWPSFAIMWAPLSEPVSMSSSATEFAKTCNRLILAGRSASSSWLDSTATGAGASADPELPEADDNMGGMPAQS